MRGVKEYLQEPATIWKIVVGLILLGVSWANLNNSIEKLAAQHVMYNARVVALEASSDNYALDIVEVKTKLANIETLLIEMRQK